MRRRRTLSLSPFLLGALTVVALGGACGGSTPHSERLAPLFATERSEEARELAPELMAEADRARARSSQAEEAGEEEAAADASTEARLWLLAAITRADTLRLQREAEAHREARIESEIRAMRDEEARRAIVARLAWEESGELAEQRASQAIAHAVRYERRRLRRDDEETRRLYRETTRALLARTRALVAAARAMGAEATRADALDSRVSEVAGERRPEEHVDAADGLLRDAMRLLGDARRDRGGPTPAELQSLLDEAGTRGLVARRTERGLELSGEAIARGRDLEGVASLLAAHPHGGVLILTVGPTNAQRRLKVVARRVRAGLVDDGISEDRLGDAEVVTDVEDPSVSVVLVAY